MKYPIGTKIGNITVLSIDNKGKEKGKYIVQCDCGEKIISTTTSIDSMVRSLEKIGFIGCMKCRYDFTRNIKMTTEEKYNTIYCRYRKSAKQRGLEFNISLKEAAELFSSACVYCKQIPTNTCIRTKLMTYTYTGIDRLDNNKGYIKNNVVPCCKYCNMAKYTNSVTDFLKHCERIYLNNVQRLERKFVESSDSKWEASLQKQINKEEEIVQSI